MIVTLHAAQMYIERIDPAASLHQAWRALHPSPAIEQHVRHCDRRQFTNGHARIVCRHDRVAEAWPLSFVVSGGPLR